MDMAGSFASHRPTGRRGCVVRDRPGVQPAMATRARPRGDERRRRLVRRRGAPARRRARGRRRHAAPLGLPGRRPRPRARPLLRARGPVRRAPRRRRARLPALHLRPPRALRAHRRRALRRRLPRGRDAQPVHGLQPRREARRALRARRPARRARASRRATTRASSRDERRHAAPRDGRDRSKDQSYFLYASPRAWLERLVFPLGDSTKARGARRGARARPPGRGQGREPGALLRRRRGARVRGVRRASAPRVACAPGPSSTTQGRSSARTRACTASPSASARARRRARHARVRDAHRPGDRRPCTSATRRRCSRTAPSWSTSSSPTASRCPLRARVRVRYRHDGDEATVRRRGGATARDVAFDDPCARSTRGQIAVLYDGDRVARRRPHRRRARRTGRPRGDARATLRRP